MAPNVRKRALISKTADRAGVVICGAGIAGIATAYFLSRRLGLRDVALVDSRPPLSLTSDKSSEGYRNWWPGPGDAMVRLMNRSIDLLEELAAQSGNRFHLNRRGYVYLTADPERTQMMMKQATEIAQLGAGPLRLRDSAATDSPSSGADLIRSSSAIHDRYPFLAGDTTALLHAHRCGWLSAQQLGMYLLEEARAAGVRLINGQVTGVTLENGRVQSIVLNDGASRQRVATNVFVIAAGPLLARVAALLDIQLPVYNEPHSKIAFEDREGIIDRSAPLMIWNDPIYLPWAEEERIELAVHEETRWLLEPFPPGLHFRPEGGPGSQTIVALWPYHAAPVNDPVWPIEVEPEFVEIVMRGLARMIPGMSIYLERMSKPTVDGGYYTKTRENRPLICPLPVPGAFVIGALSGFGVMAALGAAELLTAHIAGSSLPTYAEAFDLARYQDPAYQKMMETWSPTAGQL